MGFFSRKKRKRKERKISFWRSDPSTRKSTSFVGKFCLPHVATLNAIPKQAVQKKTAMR